MKTKEKRIKEVENYKNNQKHNINSKMKLKNKMAVRAVPCTEIIAQVML